MSRFMSRIYQWLNDPFGKERIRKHNHVLEAMHETTARTKVVSKKITKASEEPKFPIGHMIGPVHTKRIVKSTRRS